MFKALCDQFEVACQLIRGDYGRVYNIIQVPITTSSSSAGVPPPTVKLVIDVTHRPGNTLPTPSNPEGFSRNIFASITL